MISPSGIRLYKDGDVRKAQSVSLLEQAVGTLDCEVPSLRRVNYNAFGFCTLKTSSIELDRARKAHIPMVSMFCYNYLYGIGVKEELNE